jgi:hypothetical protein
MNSAERAERNAELNRILLQGKEPKEFCFQYNLGSSVVSTIIARLGWRKRWLTHGEWEMVMKGRENE